MDSSKKVKTSNPKKGKSVIKLKLVKSNTDTEDSEHESESSYYRNDRVKLMKNVLQILKPQKIRSMAFKWMSGLDINEIKCILFEELLDISNKRPECIFNCQNQEENSTLRNSENEQQKPDDMISLEDVTDDEFAVNLNSDDEYRSKQKKPSKIVTEECKEKEKRKRRRKKRKKKKRNKHDSSKTQSKADKEENKEDPINVLELLEMQVRATAIRSQLDLENKRMAELKEKARNDITRGEKSDNEEAIIINSPKQIKIIIIPNNSKNEKSNSRSGNNWDAGSSRQKDKPNSKWSISGYEQASDKSKDEDDKNRSNNEQRDDNGSMDDFPRNDGSSRNTSEKENLSLRDIPSTSKQTIIADPEPRTSKVRGNVKINKNRASRKRHLSQENDESEPRSKLTSLRAIENTDPRLVSDAIDLNGTIVINVDQSKIEGVTSG